MNHFQAVDENKAAEILGLSVQTLRNWRHQSKGPAYSKLGRSVRYDLEDISAFLTQRKIKPEIYERAERKDCADLKTNLNQERRK